MNGKYTNYFNLLSNIFLRLEEIKNSLEIIKEFNVSELSIYSIIEEHDPSSEFLYELESWIYNYFLDILEDAQIEIINFNGLYMAGDVDMCIKLLSTLSNCNIKSIIIYEDNLEGVYETCINMSKLLPKNYQDKICFVKHANENE